MGYGEGYVTIGDEKLHYLRLGSGKRLLIAFHGYANDAGLFAPFEEYLGTEFTLICVDLPHHGASKWSHNVAFTIDQLKTLVDTLCKEAGVDKVSLMGYSIGGRICLCIAEQMPACVDNILLIAADGLVFNPFYYFVTKNFFGKRLFKSFLGNIKAYMPLVNFLKNLKIIPAARYKFGMQYLQTADSREFLLQVWPAMSRIVPNERRLRAAIKQYKIPVHVFMGTYDKVIPLRNANAFKRDLETVHLHVVEKGHRMLDNDTIPKMAECLLA